MNPRDPAVVGEDMLHWVPRGSALCYGYFDWEGPVDVAALSKRLASYAATACDEGGRVRVECPSENAVVVAAICISSGGTYGAPSSRLGDQRYW